MSIATILLWALLGWTGVVWPPLVPKPPDSRWLAARFVNMIGSVIGGILWAMAWPPLNAGDNVGIAVGASCIGAVIGAALASDIARALFWNKPGA